MRHSLTLIAVLAAVAAAPADEMIAFNEPNFASVLAANGWPAIHEGFEDSATWGPVRSTIVYGSYAAPDAFSQGITWDGSGGGLHAITTSEGAAHGGQWGFYSSPHGDILAGIPDGCVVTSDEPMYAFGIWVRGTWGADITLILDGDEVNSIDLGERCGTDPNTGIYDCVDRNVANTPFVGIIDPDGFHRIEIRETEAGGDEAQYLWFDDATIAFGTLPSPRTRGTAWDSAAGGDFATGANWLGGTAPNAADNAIFNLDGGSYGVTLTAPATVGQMVVATDAVTLDLGGTTLDLTEGNILRDSLIVGELPGDAAALAIGNGQVHAENAVVGRASGATGAASIGAGGALTLSQNLRIGANGDGTLSIVGGGTVDCLHGLLGQFGGHADVAVSGGALQAAGVLVAGQSGSANLSLTAGDIAAGSVDIGYGGDATITLDGSGSALTATTLSVGTGNQVGSFFSFGADYYHGDLVVRGGASATSATSYIGETRRGIGTLTVSGPGSSWHSQSGNVFIGYEGDGTLNVLDGATVTTGQSFVGRFGIRDVLRGAANVDGAGSTWNPTYLYVGFNNDTNCASTLGLAEGTLSVTDGGQVLATQMRVAERTNSQGTVFVEGPGSLIAAQSVRLGRSGNHCNSSAAVHVSTGGLLRSAGSIDNYDGVLDLAGGAVSASEIVLYGPVRDPNLPSDPNLAGRLTGGGTITGNVTNRGGRVQPDHVVGPLDIDGDLTQDPNQTPFAPTLEVDVAPTGHDQVTVTGAARIGGALQIVLPPGFVPDVGASFEVLSAASVTGSFDTIHGAQINADHAFVVRIESDRVILDVVGTLLTGDANGDGRVDLTDLAIVLAGFGSCSGETTYLAEADFDGNGCIDLTDLGILLSNFGR